MVSIKLYQGMVEVLNHLHNQLQFERLGKLLFKREGEVEQFEWKEREVL
ncbi:hypothetical protein [Listeria grandensis]|nr:hypothetical protein [Listeria grandensis]